MTPPSATSGTPRTTRGRLNGEVPAGGRGGADADPDGAARAVDSTAHAVHGRPAGEGPVPATAGAVLAVDAGNSKTDVALVAADGRVVGTARGGGFQPARVGAEAAVNVVAEAVERAAAEAAAAGTHTVGHVAACLANADLPVEEEQLAAELRRRGWSGSVEVRNDTFAILRAGVAEPRGVAVVCGAGINCVGMLPDGRTARFPAIGRISGDWGGGGGLAEEALWHAARAEDGRGGPTALARTLPGHFGLATMYDLIVALHLGASRRHGASS